MTSTPVRRVTVSIVTPCYNGARYLEQTLRSAVNQTRPPLEVIVIDDGSTDDSAGIAERFGPPVRVLRQTNHGESVARNRGIAEAKGSHLLFLDADDVLADRALEHLTGALDDKPGAVAIMGCSWFTGDDPASPHTVKEVQPREFFPDIIESNFSPPLCWMAPVEIVRAVGGFCEELRWFEDWDLWWRVALEQPELVPVAYVGARYRQHPQSQLATTKPADRAWGHAMLMARMAAAFLERPAMLETYGDQLFWSSWTAITRAREAGVSWRQLRPLTDAVAGLVRRGPASVTSTTLASVIRLGGVKVGAMVGKA